MQTVKMVVTGPFSAGKTQFIQSVSEIDVVATERKISSDEERSVKSATTVAMDFGRITVDEDLVLYLWIVHELRPSVRLVPFWKLSALMRPRLLWLLRISRMQKMPGNSKMCAMPCALIVIQSFYPVLQRIVIL